MEYDVFISYSRKDTEVVNHIYDTLTGAGYTCFIDRQGISGGADFPTVLAQAIMDSKLCLFIASENSYASEFTLKEITFAISKKGSRFIFPLIVDDSSLPPTLELLLSNINWRRLSPRYRIHKEMLDEVRRKLQDKHAGETLKQREKNTTRLLAWLVIIVLVLVLVIVGLISWNAWKEQQSKNQARDAGKACIALVQDASGYLSRADSLEQVSGALEACLQEKACLDSAQACLRRMQELKANFQGHPYRSEGGFDTVSADALQVEEQIARKNELLAHVLKQAAQTNFELFDLTRDPVDREEALSAVNRALLFAPSDPVLISMQNALLP